MLRARLYENGVDKHINIWYTHEVDGCRGYFFHFFVAQFCLSDTNEPSLFYRFSPIVFCQNVHTHSPTHNKSSFGGSFAPICIRWCYQIYLPTWIFFRCGLPHALKVNGFKFVCLFVVAISTTPLCDAMQCICIWISIEMYLQWIRATVETIKAPMTKIRK